MIHELFRSALPEKAIISDTSVIERHYQRNVSVLHREVPLVLRPTTESEVEAVVAVANEHGVPLYPISTGKNWGLGSKLPVEDGGVVVDLGGMKRIVRVDETFGYAIIEPGVTQLDLSSLLLERYPGLMMNFTGSFAYTSVLGNTLDRGDGMCARTRDLLGVRGILGSGKRFEVGGVWEHVETNRPSHHVKYTAGPEMTGLFSQSNFGIVTQIAFRLIHRPERYHVLWGMTADEDLERLVDTIAHFRRQGIIQGDMVQIGYANRFVQAESTMRKEQLQTRDDAPWKFYVLVHGTTRVAGAIVEELTEALAPICRKQGVYCRDTDEDPHARLPTFLHPLIPQFLDRPDGSSIDLVYRLTGVTPPSDPAELDADLTPFGMRCYVPIVPVEGKHARLAADIVAILGARFDLNVKLSLGGEGRGLITIHFRTDDEDEVKRAHACEAALWDEMMKAGFVSYRAAIEQMDRLVQSRPRFFDLVEDLKKALDPKGIIAPGRYCPPTRPDRSR